MVILVVVYSVGILNDHDGVVHHDTQSKQKSKQHNHVQRKSDTWQDHESDGHRERHRKRYEQGIGRAHEEHEDERHQDEPDDDRVDQVVQRYARISALIAGNHHLQIRRKIFGFHLVHQRLDLIGRGDQVLAGAFDYVQRDDVFAVHPAETFLFFEAHFDLGDVFEIDLRAGLRGHHDVLDLLDVFEVAANGNRTRHTAHVHITGGNGHVFEHDGVFDVPEGQAGSRHFVFVHIDLHLLLQRANHIYPGDFL